MYVGNLCLKNGVDTNCKNREKKMIAFLCMNILHKNTKLRISSAVVYKE